MITTSIDGDVHVITLNRPEKRNALTPTMLDEALLAVRAAPAHARAVVLCGAGPRFCSGFDLRLCLEAPGTLDRLLRGLSELVSLLRYGQDLPVVVAAQGAAIAGGCAMLGAGDAVVTDREAKIGYPVVPLGVSPAVSAATLRRCITDGQTRARQLDPALIDGLAAVRIGLCHECLDNPTDVIPRALAIAHELASKPPAAMRATRRWIGDIERSPATPSSGDRASDLELALQASLSLVESDEQIAGLNRLFSGPS